MCTSAPRGSMGHVYVLKLRGKRWYVGYTERSSADRILEHIEGKGAKWTKANPPLKKEYLYNFSIPGQTREDEDKRTLSMMKVHGIENVRGGRWCMVDMKPYTIREIEGLIGKKSKARYKTKSKPKAKIKPKQKKQTPPPGLHDEGRLDEEEMMSLEDFREFGIPISDHLFIDKSDAWKKEWLKRK